MGALSGGGSRSPTSSLAAPSGEGAAFIIVEGAADGVCEAADGPGVIDAGLAGLSGLQGGIKWILLVIVVVLFVADCWKSPPPAAAAADGAVPTQPAPRAVVAHVVPAPAPPVPPAPPQPAPLLESPPEPTAEPEQQPSDPWTALDFTEFNQRLAEMGAPDIDYDFDYIPWEQLAPYNLVGGEGAAAFIYNLCSSQCTGDAFHYPTTLPASPSVSSPRAGAETSAPRAGTEAERGRRR